MSDRIETKIKSPFTKEEWEGLEEGDVIIDADGKQWAVLGPSKKTSFGFALILQCKGYPPEDYALIDDRIIELEEWAADVCLNHPEARIVKQSA